VRGWVIILLLAACARPGYEGHVVVAISVDWEGAELNPDGMDAIDFLRTRVPVPLTHFVCAAYFTKAEPEPVTASLREMVKPGDELAIHLHAWRSLASASGLEPRTSPSAYTGRTETDDYDGDTGYETDLDTYDVAALRALLQTSRRLLQQAALPVSHSFRAGMFLGTPKVIAAIRSEGFTTDSSAIDHREIDLEDHTLERRVAAVWPDITTTTQPFALGGGPAPIVEVPIAAFADFTTPDEITALVDAAYTRLHADPGHDQIVVLAFNLETAATLTGRVVEGIQKARARHGDLVFATVEYAAELARRRLDIAPP